MQGSIEETYSQNVEEIVKEKMRVNLKVYDVRYSYMDIATGKLKRTKKRGFKRKSEAEAFLLEINQRQNEGTFLAPKVIYFKDYINLLVKKLCQNKSQRINISRICSNCEKPFNSSFGWN